ncbi:MAG: DNA repair protein RadA [Alphaproteobacteria bacterium]|nr:DNA repair protein RadA [Alphaproteobacteria bacterium]
MSKAKKQYVCSKCGCVSSKWSGKCFECNSWDSIEEELIVKQTAASVIASGLDINLSGNLEAETLGGAIDESSRIVTSLSELNRVLGGGIVDGSVTLIGGEPGVGKSTILLQLAIVLAANNINCLYVTGEESSNQVRLRASRIGASNSAVKLIAGTNLNQIIAAIETQHVTESKKGPDSEGVHIVIIDSVQTMYSDHFPAVPGAISQIKACTQTLVNFAKQKNIALFLVGHVTKDGDLAGPKLLEHMVDTVLYLEGDQNNQYRILRSVKNRFGSVNEIGVFEMTSFGLKEVLNPSELFLMQRENNISGTCVFASIEGSRPVLVEVQALIAPSFMPMPKRSAIGWDSNRLSMILAVLNVRFGLNVSNKEVYLSIAGGLKIVEPAIDLAVAAALISSAHNKPLPQNSIFFGEIGLSGEVRMVSNIEARIKEAIKQGYKTIYCSIKPSSDFALEYRDYIKQINHVAQLKAIT